MTREELEAIISDETKYGADSKLKLGDQEISLGDLRASLTARQQARIEELNKREREITLAAQRVAEMYQQNQPGAQPAATAAADPAVTAQPDLSDDPYFKPVFGRLSAVEKALQEREQAIKGLEKQLQQRSEQFLVRLLEREYDGYQGRPKDLGFKDALKYAAEHNMVDQGGFPDIRGALDKMTEASRLKALEESAEQRGYARAEKERAAALRAPRNRVPSPGAGPADWESAWDQAAASVQDTPVV